MRLMEIVTSLLAASRTDHIRAVHLAGIDSPSKESLDG